MHAAWRQWRSGRAMSIPVTLWFAGMVGILVLLDSLSRDGMWHERIWLLPPFAATLSILVLLPQSSIAQPIPVILGSTLGAGLGSVAACLVHGPLYAGCMAAVVLVLLDWLRLYHPPGVALSMYPLLLRPGPLFSVEVVLPFMLAAVVSAAVLSRTINSWPEYPRPLELEGRKTGT
ncbi:MAG: HPP family protein [Phycisphaerae bacterium]|nr:HPP family protein [Phycisphaerae bacterium]